MKEQTYRQLAEAVNASAARRSCIIWLNRIVTMAVYLVYPALLIYLFIHERGELLPAVLIPGISFILLSIWRDRMNRPRPYEVFGMKPVISKETKGHSFPSRHIFCMFLIAVTVFRYAPLPGIIIGVAGAALAVTRVLGGVHFVKDVVDGALIGAGCGIIGFYAILPLFS